MDRTLTKILLAKSNIESTTPGNNDVDGFCRWTTPKVCGDCVSPTGSELGTREVIETTRSVAGKHSSHPARTTYLSYNDLTKGGCVNKQTFGYVPDNGVYMAFKKAERIDLGKHRRHYGIGRCVKTKTTQGDDGSGMISRQGSYDDQLNTSTPRQCNSLTEQPDTVDYQCGGNINNKEEDAQLPRGRRNNEVTATCSGDDITAKQEEQRSDSQLIKTWLYNFLPPIVTTQLGHGDGSSLRGNMAEVQSHGFFPTTSRIVSGQSRDRRLSSKRHLTNVSRVLRNRLDDRDCETGTASRRQRQRRSAASDAAVHSHSHYRENMVDVDRRRRRLSDISSDSCPVYFTETCLLPHCDCCHHNRVYSDHEDSTAVTSRFGEDDEYDDASR